MSRIAIFSKYFGYLVGGAERSTLQYLQKLEADGNSIVVLRIVAPKHLGAMSRRMSLPPTWEVRDCHLTVDFLRFRFLEYLLNKRALIELGNDLEDIDILYSYGFEAPAILSGFRGECVYMLRDEYGLGEMRNYEAGFKRFVYSIYIAVEWLPRLLWKRDLRRVLRDARVVANSKYMAQELLSKFGALRLVISAPQVDRRSLKDELHAVQGDVVRRGVVFVGDGRLKGVDIALAIARSMPDVQFYFFSRKDVSNPPCNVQIKEWSSPGYLYAHARVIIVPSRWDEAYGRVVDEACGLGIPAVISDREGLKEASGGRAHVVSNLDDIEAWVAAIRAAINGGVVSNASCI